MKNRFKNQLYFIEGFVWVKEKMLYSLWKSIKKYHISTTYKHFLGRSSLILMPAFLNIIPYEDGNDYSNLYSLIFLSNHSPKSGKILLPF